MTAGDLSTRVVVRGEALSWLDDHPAQPGASVVTSLPDLSEVPERGFEGWKTWFIVAARHVIRWLPPRGVAIFFQSDIRRGGAWVDKGYWILRAADEEAAHLLWHKIVCRKPPGTIAHGRATYSHMICVAPDLPDPPRKPGPDVLLDAGYMPWSKAMGVDACRLACRFLREETSTGTVVDPFCGRGTILAVANSMGFDSIGIDVSARACRHARELVIDPERP